MTRVGLDESVVWSIRGIRRCIALTGIGFPFVLFFGSWIFEGWPVPDSISAYYYSHSMHYVFMVTLIGLGVSLIYYQYRDPTRDGAISTWDTAISTFAGLCAIGVAVFPPAPIKDATTWQNRINYAHLACAALFFLSLAVIMIFFFTRPIGPFPLVRERLSKRPQQNPGLPTLINPWEGYTPQKRVRNQIYVFCGILILICGAVLVGSLLLQLLFKVSALPLTFVFWGETIAILSFAFAWIVKGELIFVDVKQPVAQTNKQPNAEYRTSQSVDADVAQPIAQHPLLQGLLETLPVQWKAEQRTKWKAALVAVVDLLASTK